MPQPPQEPMPRVPDGARVSRGVWTSLARCCRGLSPRTGAGHARSRRPRGPVSCVTVGEHRAAERSGGLCERTRSARPPARPPRLPRRSGSCGPRMRRGTADGADRRHRMSRRASPGRLWLALGGSPPPRRLSYVGRGPSTWREPASPQRESRTSMLSRRMNAWHRNRLLHCGGNSPRAMCKSTISWHPMDGARCCSARIGGHADATPAPQRSNQLAATPHRSCCRGRTRRSSDPPRSGATRRSSASAWRMSAGTAGRPSRRPPSCTGAPRAGVRANPRGGRDLSARADHRRGGVILPLPAPASLAQAAWIPRLLIWREDGTFDRREGQPLRELVLGRWRRAGGSDRRGTN
jgi:hypothetical protein